MEIQVAGTTLTVSGRLLRIAKMRHEWFEYLENPPTFLDELRRHAVADLFTFVQEAHYPQTPLPYYGEPATISLLSFSSYDQWWDGLHFKVRNKCRKCQKIGVELRPVGLTEDFIAGVKRIYDESPIRQDRKFPHYGKTLESLSSDLSSFPECTQFIGAYYGDELVGFMKLFKGDQIIRTIHIIAKIAHRDKNVMDGLVAKAVEICDENGIGCLHYGDWAYRGLGVFRRKFGFERHECPRYFVPLTRLGSMMLSSGFHKRLKERLPQPLVDRLVDVRKNVYQMRYGEIEGT